MTGRMHMLAALADLIREKELARLSELAKRRKELEKNLSDCREAQHRAIHQATPDPAHLAGADAVWLRLNRSRIATASEETAQAAASVEDQLVQARRAFGRAEVLRRLAGKS